jgi:DNA repair protein RecO (recombination protein O)
MHSFRTEGIIIKRQNYGEADRFLTVLTPHRGKIRVLAKGVRKISSRRSSHIELLNLSILSIHESRTPILTETETVSHFESLKSDLNKSAFAFYLCELIDGLLAEHQENKLAYELLRQALYDLEIDPDPRKRIKRFEQELLILLGFWPHDQVFVEDQGAFIESVMERRIKTKRILPSSF